MRLARTILPSLTLFLATSAAACGSSGGEENTPVAGAWPDVIKAAEKEGSVTIYSSQVTDQLQALKVAFEKKYPRIKLEYVRAAADAGVPKVEAEARTGRGIADILVTASAFWLETHSDLFAPVRGPAFDAAEYNRAENIAKKTTTSSVRSSSHTGGIPTCMPRGSKTGRTCSSRSYVAGRSAWSTQILPPKWTSTTFSKRTMVPAS
jgi:ABC-type glycerol-3-phosphate transport system substrate-binding protein